MNAFILVWLGTATVTSYQSIPSQTDSTPFYTSINERVHPHGIAVSQDQLCKACKRLHKPCRAKDENRNTIHYHDLIYVQHIGWKIANDVMHPRHKKKWDVWVASRKEESEFHKQYGGKPLKVWKLVRRNKKGV